MSMSNSVRRTVALHNLGCKVNGYESEKILQSLSDAGFAVVPFTERADVYIVNTCTVTNIADRKSRQMLRRAKRLNPDALVVAIGCYVDTADEASLHDLGVDLALPNKEKGRVVEELQSLRQAQGPHREQRPRAVHPASHTRAFLKIQDGCNLFCSYCIIPYARGRSTSVPVEDVLREAASIAETGRKEIVLTGIHISSYHDTTDGNVMGLIDLVEALQETEGIERIRLGSLEPRLINETSAKRLAALPKVCPHFHLSLQSGCDATLRRMERRYTTDDYRRAVHALRENFDRPAITTDVITGFPGESEAKFEESRRFIEEIDFYETHVFKYSARKGTKAAGMPGQLTERDKAARSDILLAMSAAASKRYRAQFLGQTQEVLFEEEEEIGGKRYRVGHTTRYVRVGVAAKGPDGDHTTQEARSQSPSKGPDGEIHQVRVTSFLNDETLAGELPVTAPDTAPGTAPDNAP